MDYLRPTFSRTRPWPDCPFEVLRGVTSAEKERSFEGQHAFCVVTDGSTEVESNGRRFTLNSGEAASLGPAGTHFSRTVTPTCDFIVVLVSAFGVEKARRRLDLPRDLLIKTRHLTERTAVRTILELADAIDDIVDEAAMDDRLDECIAVLATLPDRAPLRDAATCVNDADLFLRTTRSQVSLDELVEIVDVDRLTLIRSFVEEVGSTPLMYHQRVRLEMARHLLDDGAAIGQVATLTGFRTAGEFTRQFRRQYGFTAARYAAQADTAAPSLPRRRAALA